MMKLDSMGGLGSYYETFKRQRNAANIPQQHQDKMMDSTAYMHFLEIQLERVSAACLGVKDISEIVDELGGATATLEEKVLNVTKLVRLAQTYSEGAIEELSTRVTTLESCLEVERVCRQDADDKQSSATNEKLAEILASVQAVIQQNTSESLTARTQWEEQSNQRIEQLAELVDSQKSQLEALTAQLRDIEHKHEELATKVTNTDGERESLSHERETLPNELAPTYAPQNTQHDTSRTVEAPARVDHSMRRETAAMSGATAALELRFDRSQEMWKREFGSLSHDLARLRTESRAGLAGIQGTTASLRADIDLVAEECRRRNTAAETSAKRAIDGQVAAADRAVRAERAAKLLAVKSLQFSREQREQVARSLKMLESRICSSASGGDILHADVEAQVAIEVDKRLKEFETAAKHAAASATGSPEGGVQANNVTPTTQKVSGACSIEGLATEQQQLKRQLELQAADVADARGRLNRFLQMFELAQEQDQENLDENDMYGDLEDRHDYSIRGDTNTRTRGRRRASTGSSVPAHRKSVPLKLVSARQPRASNYDHTSAKIAATAAALLRHSSRRKTDTHHMSPSYRKRRESANIEIAADDGYIDEDRVDSTRPKSRWGGIRLTGLDEKMFVRPAWYPPGPVPARVGENSPRSPLRGDNVTAEAFGGGGCAEDDNETACSTAMHPR